MTRILIGIDDTDNETSRGTGYLARQLCRECQERGMRSIGVTRHQFLVDPRIPYTSHNSGACIALQSEEGIEAAEFVFDFIAQRAAEGSDPGVCLAEYEDVNDEIFRFSQAATSRIVTMEEAFAAAGSASICLRGLGGTCLGVIGALGSVGLRAEGNEGRFIDMPDLRDMPERVNAQTITELGIELRYQENGRSPHSADAINTLEWIRPRLIEGKAVLLVKWSKNKNAWIPVDRKKSRPLE